MVVIQDLAAGRDTMAGIAHRYGLPVQTLMTWQAQCPPADGRETLLQGIKPMQSRIAGDC
jgi:hypothetical protein